MKTISKTTNTVTEDARATTSATIVTLLAGLYLIIEDYGNAPGKLITISYTIIYDWIQNIFWWKSMHKRCLDTSNPGNYLNTARWKTVLGFGWLM